jgi:hypothetical protein
MKSTAFLLIENSPVTVSYDGRGTAVYLITAIDNIFYGLSIGRKSSNHRRLLLLHKSDWTILHPLLDVGNVPDPLHQVLNEGRGGECPALQPRPHVEHHEVGPGEVVPGKELAAAAGQPCLQVSQHDLADGLEFGLNGFLNFENVSSNCYIFFCAIQIF